MKSARTGAFGRRARRRGSRLLLRRSLRLGLVSNASQESAPSGSYVGTRRRAPRQRITRQPPTEREEWEERLAAKLDMPVTVLGIVLVLVLIADNLTPSGSRLRLAFDIVEIVGLVVLVFEFVLRVRVAPSTGEFLRRNWWQLIFVILPFFRPLRLLSRTARIARVAAASARASRSGAARLGGRVAWLIAITITVILASSQLLFEYGPHTTYPDALHDTAIATFGGQVLGSEGVVSETLEVFLILYSVVVFGAAAAVLGAFWVEGRIDALRRTMRAEGGEATPLVPE